MDRIELDGGKYTVINDNQEFSGADRRPLQWLGWALG